MLRASFLLNGPFETSRSSWLARGASLSLLLAASACSSEKSPDGGAKDTGVSAACSDETRVGSLTLSVVPPNGDVPGYSEFSGSVSDKITPSDVWVERKKEGDCRIMVGPKLTCAPSCKVGEVCAGNNVCTSEPTGQNVGDITLSGLSSAVTAKINGALSYYAPVSGVFPPAASGSAITLTTSGATYPAFSLSTSAIDPLIVANDDVTLDASKPLTFSWGAPSVAGKSRIRLSLDLAHHGNIAAKLICDVADTGSATIPTSMLTALVAEGVAGFPSVAITRSSVASTNIAPGCVEFSAASSVIRALVLPGVVSCQCPGDTCDPCTASQTCKDNYICG